MAPEPALSLYYLVVFGSIALFGVAGVLAFRWAFRSGQFENFQRSSRAIFDPDEPVGEVTDRFPGMRPRHPEVPDDREAR
jgi:cbb3-type cytochrome oxidase maturation protein